MSNKILLAIKKYFNISEECSIYIYYRFLRSLKNKNNKKYLPWSIEFQNALIKADKTLGINWITLDFTNELNTLEQHGIDIDDQDNNVFRWVDTSDYKDTNTDHKDTDVSDESHQWKTVTYKKIRSNDKQIVKKFGLFV